MNLRIVVGNSDDNNNNYTIRTYTMANIIYNMLRETLNSLNAGEIIKELVVHCHVCVFIRIYACMRVPEFVYLQVNCVEMIAKEEL